MIDQHLNQFDNRGFVAPSIEKTVSIIDRLKRQRDELSMRLKDTEDAIRNLEKYPEVIKVLESLNKLGHY